MTSVFFITHPEVVVDPLIPVPHWKLSPRGVARIRLMLEQDWVADIGHIVASEERNLRRYRTTTAAASEASP